MGDFEFLTEGIQPDKVTREVALQDFKRFIDDKGLAEKIAEKVKGDSEEDRQDFESAKEIVVKAIMKGTLRVSEGIPCKLIHKLREPLTDYNGNMLYDTLEYNFVPDIIALRKTDGFKDDQTMAKTQALLAAMTHKSVKELGKISSVEIPLIAAIAFFLI